VVVLALYGYLSNQAILQANSVCTILFAIEAGLKVVAFGLDYFF
jgi:hypothetical protein